MKLRESPGGSRAGVERSGQEREAGRGTGQEGQGGMLGSVQWNSCRREGLSGAKSRS